MDEEEAGDQDAVQGDGQDLAALPCAEVPQVVSKDGKAQAAAEGARGRLRKGVQVDAAAVAPRASTQVRMKGCDQGRGGECRSCSAS